MGGAASRDFIDGAPKTTVAQELDELGGYDRPALAKNQSFTARLDWLGTQVGKASEQIEAALSKDDQAGRRELEKEAKRRQLMAVRRGQGDWQLNAQFAEFYLKQKQYERPPVATSPSILRNAPGINAAADAAVAAAEPSSPRADAARRSAEHVATLQRLYSRKDGTGSFTSQGSKPAADAGGAAGSGSSEGGAKEEVHAPPSPKPVPAPATTAPRSPIPGSRWRQTVAQAKKTAFLAVGSVLAMNGKRRIGPNRIDNFALFAEHQLGDGMPKFIEESERLAAAREKLPGMKAELEKLRAAMRLLAIEQESALVAAGGDEEEEEEEPVAEELSSINENDGLSPEEAATVAASAAAAVRHKRNSQTGMEEKSNKPRWHYASNNNGFGPPPSLAALPKPKPFSPRVRDGAPPSPSTSAPGHMSFTYTPTASSLPSPSTSAGLPTVGPNGTAPGFGSGGRGRRVSAGSPGVSQSLNGPVSSLLATAAPGSSGQGPSLGTAGGLNRRGSIARSSWSGGTGGVESLGTPPVLVHGSGSEAARAMSASGTSGAPLRPSRPFGSALGSRTGGPHGLRSRSEPAAAPGPAAAAAAAVAATTGRPASAVRAPLLSPRPPSALGNAHRPMSSRPGAGEQLAKSVAIADLHAATPGEHRVGTMAQRIASKVALPLRTAAKAQLRALREAETANVLRQAQLVAAIEESTSILQTAGGLLNMYCNRANGRWVELQNWALPHVHEVTMPAVRRQAERYKELVMKDLKAGKLAVQIHVDDDVFSSSRLGPVPLWSMDPWQLLAMTHPARAEWTAHLVGLGMGVRQLLALATAVEAAAGPEAVARMPVVVCCHEGQVDAVVRDVSARKLCRFSPENFIIMVQQRAPGHVYDRARRTFVPRPEAPPRPVGSGYAMLALNWSGDDVFRLGGPELTQRIPMEKSPLALLEERDVQWLSSWRLRDLVHYSPDSCLNLEQLAVSYALADSLDANMSLQVDLVDTMQGVNRGGSGIVLALKQRAAPPPPPTAAVANVPLLRARPDSSSNKPAAAPSGSPGATGSSGLGMGSPPTEGMWPTAASAGMITTRSTSPSAPTSAESAPLAKQPTPPEQPPPPQHPHPHIRQRPQSPLQIPSPPLQSVSAPPSPMPLSPLLAAGAGAGQRVASAGARAGGIGSDGGPLPTCDIKWSDVQTPALASGLQQLIDAATAQMGSSPRLAVSIKRYTFHVPSLRGLLSSPSVFRPCVSVGENGYLYVTFDASDLTALPGARCVALTYASRSSAGAAAAASVAADPAAAGQAAHEGPSTTASGSGGGATLLPPVQSPAAAGSPVSAGSNPSVAPGAANSKGSGGGSTSSHAAGGNGLHSPSRKNIRGTPAHPARAGSGGAGANAPGAANSATVAAAAAAAAAAAMQRGRLLTNDYDLDTLAWVVSDQDASPAFRAAVSATNTARSRVTAHAPGGVAAATGAPLLPGRPPPQNVIVVAVTDDLASQLAVRTAMAIMKPGADCLHVLTIAKDISATATSTARAVAERFESLASATLGDVRSVVQVKQQSIVEDVLAYAESVRAVLLVTGSMTLASQQGSSVVGSVALSLARDSSRPILVVKSNARLVEGVYEVGKKPCLRALLAAEPTGRPLVRYVVSHVLDGGRGDKVVLLRGRAFDKQMNELVSGRRILDHLADEATSNRRFDMSLVVRRMTQGSFEAEHQRVADADQCHIVGVQVPDGRGPLPSSIVSLLRTSRAAVLLYRSQANRPAPPPATDEQQEQQQPEEQQHEPQPEQRQQEPQAPPTSPPPPQQQEQQREQQQEQQQPPQEQQPPEEQHQHQKPQQPQPQESQPPQQEQQQGQGA